MKSGIDYFPLDVRLDQKFELIEAEFGLKGFGVVVKLYQNIYGGEGYYIEWTEEVALLFSDKVKLSCNAVSEIVSAAIKRGIFDKELYDKYHILTSKGIQERYFEAVSRRKELKVKNEYLLINCAQICKNANIPSENVDVSSENVDIPKQSKVEKSRVEESKVHTSPAGAVRAPQTDELFDRFWRAYPRKSNKKDAEKAFRAIKHIDTTLLVILEDIEKRRKTAMWTEQNGRFIPYPATYLRGEQWKNEMPEAANPAPAQGKPLASGYVDDKGVEEYERMAAQWRPVLTK